jgi:hypothetical protein
LASFEAAMIEAGRALRFTAGERSFSVARALEVVPVEGFTALPGAKEHLPGVFLVRGEVVPLVDLAALLEGKPLRYKRAVVVRTEAGPLAFGVSTVEGFGLAALGQTPLAADGLTQFFSEMDGALAIDAPGLAEALAARPNPRV